MKRNWLYLPIEVKVRECDAKLLLAYHAIQQGYNVIIGDHPVLEQVCGKYPQGIFFSKGGPHGFRQRVISSALEKKHSVVELDEEGLIFQKKLYLQDRMQKQTLHLVEQEYCWGPHQYNTILSAYPDLKAKLHITGNPRFDLLTPKYRKLYEADRLKLKAKYGDFILINTRFSRYNTPKGLKESIHYQHIQKLYEHFLKMIQHLASLVPDKKIIIRPHPGENFTSYRKALQQYTNILVVHEGNIIPWLYAAEAVIHHGCTSGMEAYLLGRPVISYIPFETMEPSLPNQFGQIARNSDEIIRNLEKFINKETLPPVTGKMEDYVQWSPSHDSCQTILSLCNQISLSLPLDRFSKKEGSKMIVRTKKRKRNFSLTKDEIVSFFQKMNQVNETEILFEVKPVANHVFHLSC
ncbi:hypothetical protein F9U64_11030 [Gracilibacillus oryzae]|uniref:Surface carbohydrate biosynthesis protein n=1 Tax=Gracilibacillus oryzae TaxID=1672701 RepID=A0A7C8KQ60_9BACI|nr:surface carbohydrate biosynthesis protein [Gracilibacillus oryzae]KAB8135794.1 hypothetical protein F9U64_11030 [Gracilibacillus oryzae]